MFQVTMDEYSVAKVCYCRVGNFSLNQKTFLLNLTCGFEICDQEKPTVYGYWFMSGVRQDCGAGVRSKKMACEWEGTERHPSSVYSWQYGTGSRDNAGTESHDSKMGGM